MSPWTLIRRNLGRNRVRTILTTLAVAFLSFLVCAVLTLPAVRDTFLAHSASSLRLMVRHKAGLGYLLPLAYVQRVRTVPHVVSVNHWTWFGGIYNDPKDQFPNFAVDAETVGEVWPERGWDPAVLDTFKHARNSALVGVRTMEKFGWKIGDEITLRGSPFGVDLAFKIVGQIPLEKKDAFAVALWFPRQYLEEALQAVGGFGLVGLMWVRVDQLEHVNTVKAAIDDLFRNSEAETVTETELSYLTNFLRSFDALITMVMLVGFLVITAIVLIIANTVAMSVRERVAEVAVLKTIGFRRRMIFALLLSEELVITSLGGGLGVSLAYLILNSSGSGAWAPFLGPLSLSIMPVSVMIQGLLLMLLVGLLASVIPARGAARLNVAAALRQIA